MTIAGANAGGLKRRSGWYRRDDVSGRRNSGFSRDRHGFTWQSPAGAFPMPAPGMRLVSLEVLQAWPCLAEHAQPKAMLATTKTITAIFENSFRIRKKCFLRFFETDAF